MKIKARELANEFQSIAGDSLVDTDDKFLINGINWCLRELPMVPGLERAFSRHYTVRLDSKGEFKWLLNQDFRRLLDIPMINFWTSTGGEPCKLNVCNRPNKEFYDKNGLIELRKPGQPCEYTIEKEGDDIMLVFDRPLDVPVIIDYIAWGVPKPITDLDKDELDISSIMQNLILMTLRNVWWQEADDLAFSGAILDYLDNKYLPEAVQELNRRWRTEAPIILGN